MINTPLQQSLSLLCSELNQPIETVESFILSLKIFTDKGMSIDQAIEAHLKTSLNLLNNSVKISESKKIKQMAVDWFYE